MAPLPKLKQRTFSTKDLHSTFLAPEEVVGFNLKYKWHPGRGYWYQSDASRFTFQASDEAIKTELYGRLTLKQLEQYAAWLDGNAVTHRTKIYWDKPKTVTLNAGDTLSFPEDIEVTHCRVESVVHRRLTDQQRADIAAAEQNKTERAAIEKAKAAEIRKKQRAAERKRVAAQKAREERQDLQAEELRQLAQVGDLAVALKTLKKHGLKVVVVKENGD